MYLQNSISSSSQGVLHAVNNMQSLVPAEIASRHKGRARPDKASYQIRLYESEHGKPTKSVLCLTSETQTDISGNDLERLDEEQRLAKSTMKSLERENKKQSQDIDRFERIFERQRSEIEGLKRELELARRNNISLRNNTTSSGSRYNMSLWPKPAPPRGKGSYWLLLAHF